MFQTQKPESSTKVIVLRGEPLDENQLTQALQFGDRTWVALVQLIEGLRREHLETANGWVPENNALGIARDVGASEALTELLTDLNNRRLPNP
jgi:hypothetical protein